MKCDYIIAIGIQPNVIGSENEDAIAEIEEDIETLELKHKNRNENIVTLGIEGDDEETWDQDEVIEDIETNFEEQLNDLKKSKCVGLYYVCHGTAGDIGPGADNLASLTFEILNMGINIRKINLSACKTGVTPEDPDNLGLKSSLDGFCAKLSQLLGEDGKKKCDGLMVAGYAYNVERYNSTSKFYKDRTWIGMQDVRKKEKFTQEQLENFESSNIREKDKYHALKAAPEFKGGIVKTTYITHLEVDYKTYEPIRPDLKSFNKKAATLNHPIKNETDMSKISDKQKSKITSFLNSHKAAINKFNDYAENKIVNKLALGSWRRCSLQDWSNSEDIKSAIVWIGRFDGTKFTSKYVATQSI